MNKQEQATLIQQASAVVTNIFEAANSGRYLQGLDYYSADPQGRFVSDGIIHTLDDLKQVYAKAGDAVEHVHNEILEWNVKVLSESLIAFTLPVQLTLKFKGLPEYTGQIIWSAVLTIEDGQWRVIQSHESWTNVDEVLKALSQADES